MPQTPQFDVLIAGGGPVGACAAALLASASRLRVGILEPNRPPAPLAGASIDLRVSAFSRASERILSAAGAWGRLDAARISPYERMRVWHESSAPRGPDALIFDAADVGEPNLGYIIENRPVQLALLDSFEASGGRVIAAEVAALAVQDECVRVTTADSVLSTRLLVGADGARSRVREAVGITADTAEFAVASIRLWLERMGRQRYPEARELTITADCGGSNGARVRLWKVELQKLADETGLTLHVRHYPPGTSKWNRIEHRLFCHITQTWRGRPLTDRLAVVELIGATTTQTGLKVECALDPRTYQKDVKVSHAEIAALNLEGDDFHPEWNYSIRPRNKPESQ